MNVKWAMWSETRGTSEKTARECDGEWGGEVYWGWSDCALKQIIEAVTGWRGDEEGTTSRSVTSILRIDGCRNLRVKHWIVTLVQGSSIGNASSRQSQYLRGRKPKAFTEETWKRSFGKHLGWKSGRWITANSNQVILTLGWQCKLPPLRLHYVSCHQMIIDAAFISPAASEEPLSRGFPASLPAAFPPHKDLKHPQVFQHFCTDLICTFLCLCSPTSFLLFYFIFLENMRNNFKSRSAYVLKWSLFELLHVWFILQ